MLDFIMNRFRFQYKASSVEEFVKVVKRDACKTVVVTPCLDANDATKTRTVGVIANFQYALEFLATTSRGREIIYLEPSFERFGSDRGFADAKERRSSEIKHLLVGQQKVSELRTKLRNVSVNLIGADGQLFDDAACVKLQQDAANYGVSI